MHLIPKKRPQSSMGIRFTCVRLSQDEDLRAALPSSPVNSDDEFNTTNDDISETSNATSLCSESTLVLTSPPRKSVRESPMRRRIIRARNKPHRNTGRFIQPPQLFSPSPLRKSRNAASSSVKNPSTQEQGTSVVSHNAITLSFSSTLPTTTDSPTDNNRIASLRLAREENNRLQSEIDASKDTIRKLELSLASARMKLSRSEDVTAKRRVKNGNPTERLRILMQQWQQQQIPISGIADAVVKAISTSKKLRNEVCSQIIENESEFPDLYKHFSSKIYQEVKYKFRPWLCLQELDLNASVSFRAYDAIRMIEFAEEENKKY